MLTKRKLILSLALVSLTALASAGPLVYAVTDSKQFGTADLASGAFHLISTTADLQYGLVAGPNGYLSLSRLMAISCRSIPQMGSRLS
jgi:hypothetical protein